MDSLMINFLSSKGKLKAYPCGINVKESKKMLMLTGIPEFKKIDFVSTRTKLRDRLAKGTKAPAKANVADRD